MFAYLQKLHVIFERVHSFLYMQIASVTGAAAPWNPVLYTWSSSVARAASVWRQWTPSHSRKMSSLAPSTRLRPPSSPGRSSRSRWPGGGTPAPYTPPDAAWNTWCFVYIYIKSHVSIADYIWNAKSIVVAYLRWLYSSRYWRGFILVKMLEWNVKKSASRLYVYAPKVEYSPLRQQYLSCL